MIKAFEVTLSCCTFNFIFANLKHEAFRLKATWEKYSKYDQQYLEKITPTLKHAILSTFSSVCVQSFTSRVKVKSLQWTWLAKGIILSPATFLLCIRKSLVPLPDRTLEARDPGLILLLLRSYAGSAALEQSSYTCKIDVSNALARAV